MIQVDPTSDFSITPRPEALSKALFKEVRKRNADIGRIQQLISDGASTKGALLWAAVGGNPEIIQLVMQSGEKPDDALLEATSGRHAGAVCALLEVGANVNARDDVLHK